MKQFLEVRTSGFWRQAWRTLPILAVLMLMTPFGALALPPVAPNRVLVVMNTQSPDAVAIAKYYIQKRKIPAANLCKIACPMTEDCLTADYNEKIQKPIKTFLAKNRLDIDFILLTKGVPIRLSDGPQASFCVDSLLCMMDWSLLTTRTVNPYFNREERFSHKKYKMYLVTRLDGYSRADCLKLVDRSLAGKPNAGPFLIHLGPGHEDGGYKMVNDGMRKAHALLSGKGKQALLDTKPEFTGNMKDLMGYFSWGSNDAKYDKTAYNSLGFVPGSIAETAVSTSGRTFSDPKAPGQSLIADLIAQGVTGCKGYVSEPYADSIAHADILFDSYTEGYSLAESFYMASYCCYWKDIVIGDPLCAPYAK